MSNHGVQNRSDAFAGSYNCSELVVGRAKEPALLCAEVDVLDVETKLEVLDSPRIGSPPMLALRLGIAGDGMSATLDELGKDNTCKALLAATAPHDAGDQVWSDFDRAQETRLCSTRGTYRWKADRFQRAK